jgi:hypothetical protein
MMWFSFVHRLQPSLAADFADKAAADKRTFLSALIRVIRGKTPWLRPRRAR